METVMFIIIVCLSIAQLMMITMIYIIGQKVDELRKYIGCSITNLENTIEDYLDKSREEE